MPAYLVISELHGGMPVLAKPVAGGPLESIKRQHSVPAELDAAVGTVLAASRRREESRRDRHRDGGPLRRGDLAAEFIRRANIPFAVTPNDKGTLDESLPQFMGLYAGLWSSSQAVCDVVAKADLVLDIGGLVTSELNTGMWTAVADLRKS